MNVNLLNAYICISSEGLSALTVFIACERPKGLAIQLRLLDHTVTYLHKETRLKIKTHSYTKIFPDLLQTPKKIVLITNIILMDLFLPLLPQQKDLLECKRLNWHHLALRASPTTPIVMSDFFPLTDSSFMTKCLQTGLNIQK